MPPPYAVAVLTVSDTAHAKGPSYDLSGPHLSSLISAHPAFALAATAIVPDDVDAIRAQVVAWTEGDEKVDWVISTGGTGWGPRDVTPLALSPLLSPLPVLLHHLSTTFLARTPRSILSRPLVGLLGRSLVLCLPGSKKACQEGWEAMVDAGMGEVLEHGFELLRGGSGEDVHPPRESVRREVGSEESQMPQASTGGHHHHHHGRDHDHSHSHHHHHHRPTPRSLQPGHAVSDRLRSSPYPLLPLSTALSLLLTLPTPLPPVTLPVAPSLRAHVLAEHVTAPAPIPAGERTNVDGYAVCAGEGGGVFEVVGRERWDREGGEGKKWVVRVNTGGPVPSGLGAVVMVEDTELVSKTPDGQESHIRILPASIPAGDNIRLPGSDVRAGERVLDKGTVLGGGGGEVGLLGFVGRREVSVIRRPKVALMSTGNELTDLHSPLDPTASTSSGGWGGVVDTNRPSLKAAMEAMGYEVVDLGIARDTLEEQRAALVKGLEVADVVVSTGGTSMGEADFLKPLIEHDLGGEIHFGRVAMKPGKPTTFASVPQPSGPPKYVFALPGNPASALVTFYLFVLPLLRGLGGWPEGRRQLGRVWVELTSDMPLDPREEFHRVVIHSSMSRSGVLLAVSTGGQRSSRVASLSGANGLVHLPSRDVAGVEWKWKGELVEAVVIGEILTGTDM